MGAEYEQDNIINTSPEDEDAMLPEGYGADDDIFADPQKWTGERSDEGTGQSADGEDGKGDGAEDAPTTAQETTQDVQGNDDADAPTTEQDAPTTAQEGTEKPNMLKFRAKYDSQETDVELKESDLPGIWQKAQNHDRMQSRLSQLQAQVQSFDVLARTMGYANAKEMSEKAADAYRDAEIKNLVDSAGVPERIAKAVVAQEMQSRSAAPAAAPQTTPAAQAAPVRNPQAEVAELLAAKPELYGKPLPQEVLVAAQSGKNLLVAYTEYEATKSHSEAERLRIENNIHKQNAANAAKAPIKGVSIGGAAKDKSGEDDFLRGFNSDY